MCINVECKKPAFDKSYVTVVEHTGMVEILQLINIIAFQRCLTEFSNSNVT